MRLVAASYWAPMELSLTSNLFSTALAYYNSAPTMNWMRLVTSLSSGGLLYSSGVSWSLVPYVISQCLCRESCALLGRECPYFMRTLSMYPFMDMGQVLLACFLS